MVGPPVMYKFVSEILNKMKIDNKNIYVSLEARMECGVGKCQHCNVGTKRVCVDGPIFNFQQVLKFPGVI